MSRQGKKKQQNNTVTINRRASFDYKLGEEIKCGLALTGPEVRLIRDHHVQLKGSFVTLRNGELWLNNLTLGYLESKGYMQYEISNFSQQKDKSTL